MSFIAGLIMGALGVVGVVLWIATAIVAWWRGVG